MKRRFRARPGPKPHKPTPINKRRVRLWAGSGVSKDTICRLLRLNWRTLEKHYAEELKSGAEMALARNLERFERAADKGSVPAMRFLHDKFSVQTGHQQFMQAVNKVEEPQAEVEPKPESPKPEPKKGKKEIALEEALNAGQGTEWGNDLETPPTVIPTSFKNIKGHA